MISLAGRLRYKKNRFFWFCQDVKNEIELSDKAYKNNPYLAELYTIWGQRDNIVPKNSSHIQNNPEKELSVEGFGHGGIIYSSEALLKATEWINQWIDQKDQSKAS